jgi:diadenosine tetraphosphatase ApaH/serine/threonine PP2A family protein phosphatase
VNVGSVGKPKDGDWRSCYSILDTATSKVQFVRLEYDVQRVTQAIRESELPVEFATDLEPADTL